LNQGLKVVLGFKKWILEAWHCSSSSKFRSSSSHTASTVSHLYSCPGQPPLRLLPPPSTVALPAHVVGASPTRVSSNTSLFRFAFFFVFCFFFFYVLLRFFIIYPKFLIWAYDFVICCLFVLSYACVCVRACVCVLIYIYWIFNCPVG